MSDYPTAEDLATIENWPIADPWGLIDFMRNIWHHDGCVRLSKKWGTDGVVRYKRLELVTLGWSGNESIIGALSKSTFWLAFWESEYRGGKYVFHVHDIKS